MNISSAFIKRPVATSLLTAALLLAGAMAYRMLPVAPLPEVAYPTIQVMVTLPGASPETMASSLATPLERMFGRIAGITEMTSNSQMGLTNITIQFDLDRDIDGAGRDVQAAINAARGQLPPLFNNPTWRKTNPAESPIMVLALTSDTATQQDMYDAGDSILAQKIAQVNGVGIVGVNGSSQPAVRIELNPLLLTNMGVGLDEVRNAIIAASPNEPKGELADGRVNRMLNIDDQMFRAKQYAPLIVAYRNGAPVRISDVGTVNDSQQNAHKAGQVNGKLSVLLNIYRQPSANIMTTVDGIRKILPMLQASISPSIHIEVTQDRTTTIRASVHEVEVTMAISVVLVILVVFVFLRSLWATAIPSVAVPLSLVGTFGVMYLLGYTIDNLSLMALTISTGFVVDDAIVVIENITRYLEQGLSPMQAALRGSREIGFTVLSMSTSLIAAFIPILLMGGIMGRIFREFAITLSAAVAISMVVSLTTTPMMCSRLLRGDEKQRKHNWLYRASERGFQKIYDGYASSLGWVLRHQPMILGLALATVGLAVYLYIVIPKGFFPQQDTGALIGNARASEDISFQSMRDKMMQFMAIVRADPAVAETAGFLFGANTSTLNITLKPLSERKISATDVVNRLRPKLARVPGATLFLQPVQDVTIGGRQANAQFQYTLMGTDWKELLAWAPRIDQKLRALPELRDVNSDLQNHALEAGVVIDRDTAGRLGLTPDVIDNALYDAFGQRPINTVYSPMNQYHVIMEMDPQYTQNPDQLKNLYVRAPSGRMVPLSAFTRFEPSTTSLAVSHQGQFPAITFSFNLAPDVPLGDAVDAVQKVERTLGLPSDVHAGFQGVAQAFQASLASEPYLILMALAAVYIVLGILYENYVHPITILSTLPSAGVGALLALLAFHIELSIIALIGIILLVGIVKKNAILMIDFAIEAERQEGNSPVESIYQACLLRFRPILMTTMAAMFGGIPIALMGGNGSELRRPLGIAIVGGLLVSQALTLYTTPVVYLYLDRFRAWASGRETIRPLQEAVAQPVAQPSAD
jgi:multidrug efflux pump